MSVCLYVFLLLLFHVLCLSLYLFPFTFTRCQVKKCITLLFLSPFFPWLPPSFLFLSFLSLVPSFLLNSHFFPSFFSSFPWFPPSFLFLLFSFPGSLLPSFQTLTSLLPSSLFRLFTNITSSIFSLSCLHISQVLHFSFSFSFSNTIIPLSLSPSVSCSGPCLAAVEVLVLW